MSSHAIWYDMSIFSRVFWCPLFVDRVFFWDKWCLLPEIDKMTIFVTWNRCLWFYKEQCIVKISFFVLRPPWDIVINSGCDFGIKHLKLNPVNKLENIGFGRQTFSKRYSTPSKCKAMSTRAGNSWLSCSHRSMIANQHLKKSAWFDGFAYWLSIMLIVYMNS